MKYLRRSAMAAIAALAVSLTPISAKAADIVETAVGAGNFTTLVKMIEAAGLVDELKGSGPFTVFAPTDEAFAKWPKAEVDLFLNPAKKEHLVRLVKLHVVPGKVKSTDLAGKKTDAKAVSGGTLKIDATDGVSVNGSKVKKADIVADNGVIHVIDTPLVPEKYRGSW